MADHDEHIRRALQDEAGRYEPDRRAIAERLARGRAAAAQKARNSPRRLFSMRPAAAALAVVGVLVATVIGVRLGDTGGTPDVVAEPPPPATAAVAGGGPSTAPPPGDTTGRPRSRPVTTAPTGKAPPATTAPSGPPRASSSSPPGASWLSTGGARGKNSVATWTENTVTVKLTKPVVALAVTVTVAATPGAAEAGKWTTVPNSDLVVTVDRAAQGLTYTYRLRDGVTLRPGTWTFAAQFTHRAGRGTSADTYVVEAATSSAEAERSGSFS